MGNKYIWLFGENSGQTANNNSFYLWRHTTRYHSADIDAYFIVESNPGTRAVFRMLTAEEKRRIVRRNSLKHIFLFEKADLLFVSVSYIDVQPQNIGPKSYKPLPTAPLVYLQHGTLAMKQLGYNRNYANNTMFRFLVYNPNIKEKLIKVNGFKDYQIYDAVYHPRYCELAKRALIRDNEKLGSETSRQEAKNILWFITWREYFEDESKARLFGRNISRVLGNPALSEYRQRTGSNFTVCLHRNFAPSIVNLIRLQCLDSYNVRIVYSGEIDVMDLLVQNDVLITDYSSVGFDFTFLGKPVILYQPDFRDYAIFRKLYCKPEELFAYNIDNPRELVDVIINERFGINPFFLKNMHLCKDLEDVASGKYVEQLVSYFWEMQRKSIAVLGYDFSGIGGTVFATRALMEGLLERGYLVRAFTLKQMRAFNVPAGLAVQPATRQFRKTLRDKIIQKFFFLRPHYGYLKYDPAKEAMRPLAGIVTARLMKNIHADTVISTRESLHLYLQEAKSKTIRNRIYYFHTSAAVVDSLFPGVLAQLQKTGIEKAAFVTERNRLALVKKHGFINYKEYCVTGNSVDSMRCKTLEEISEFNIQTKASSISLTKVYSNSEEPRKIQCLTMMRLSHERKADIEYMLKFARELKNAGTTDIHINVYGEGDYTDSFLREIDLLALDGYIEYCGETEDLRSAMEENDVVIDFSEIQSFGMTYIEGILNGKMVLCRHNEGADEVLRDIPDAYYDSIETLIRKIREFHVISREKLLENYQMIKDRYGREYIVDRLMSLIESES